MEKSLAVKLQFIIDQLAVSIDAMECELVTYNFLPDEHVKLKARLDAFLEINERLIDLFGDVIYRNS
jgi:hypothetical protein